MTEVKQVDLQTFRAMYGIPENTVLRWIHCKGLPAYKLGHKWYIVMAVNFYNMIQLIIRELPNDKYADDAPAWGAPNRQNSYQTGFDDIDASEDDLPF